MSSEIVSKVVCSVILPPDTKWLTAAIVRLIDVSIITSNLARLLPRQVSQITINAATAHPT